MWRELKRVLVGPPLRTAQAAHERLTNLKALAVFSSDALSSTAYATEEILLALVLAGSAAAAYSVPVSLAIAALLVIVAFSYRQTIRAYPSGGGAYIVAKENLGTNAGLVAGAALLIDYVLTVSVSVASGVAAITSAVPSLYEYRVVLGALAIAAITVANLRGVRESGTIFAIPTYVFIFSGLLLVGTGFYELFVTHSWNPLPPPAVPPHTGQAVTLFLLLRAFSSGCAALTGVEAISNGVPAFRPPESANAARTLTWMAATLVTLFLGVTYLAYFFGVLPKEGETVVSQIARAVFGGDTPFYYLVQAATAMILFLAANTSYADFPRLAGLIARDGFLPNQFAYRGDRLVFSNGIVVLGLLSALLVWFFRGDVHALIPLYAVGVFLSFTLSQSGMVVHWLRLRTPGWQRSVLINGLGATVTATVLVVIAATKFTHGAWAVIVLIPLFVRAFHAVHAHYEQFRAEMRVRPELVKPIRHTVLIPIGHVNQATVNTINYARSISDNIRAVYVALDPAKAREIREQWAALNTHIPLVTLDSPYRSVVGPLIHYIEKVERRERDHVITVLLPEFVTGRWWHNLLHNQTGLYIRAALWFHPGIVVTSVPYHICLGCSPAVGGAERPGGAARPRAGT